MNTLLPIRRRLSSLVAILAVLCAATASVSAQHPDEMSVEIIHMQHADVREIAESIRPVATDVNITVNQRTNALLIRGFDDARRNVRELVAKLDVPVPEVEDAGDEQVRVYELEHAPATRPLVATLSELFEQGLVSGKNVKRIRLAHDHASNQIIARGAAEHLSELAKIIEAIDHPTRTGTPSAPEMRVRLVWLVGGLGEDHGRPLPPDLQPVRDELVHIGITDLRLVSQTVVRVSSDYNFETAFTARLAEPWRIQLQGRASAGHGDKRRLEIEIGGRAEESGALSQLQTSVTTVPGHYVVLGVAPIHELDSVFVVQILDVE